MQPAPVGTPPNAVAIVDGNYVDENGNIIGPAPAPDPNVPSIGPNPNVGPDVQLPEPDFLPPDDLPAACGNGRVDDGEACDDGNTVAGTGPGSWDGCGDCSTIDPGFICPEAGVDCQLTNYCGDGRVTAPETCDDLNEADGDGCSSSCSKELGWECPVPGEPCVYAVVCGDGVLGGSEACDDFNANAGDGCSADCQIEPGWTCSTAGLRCAEVCSDSTVVGRESCDDGNMVDGDGCSAACQVEPVFEDPATNSMVGWDCPATGGACTQSVCGDGMVTGEPCDDGDNNDTGDGCSPGCRLEPDCSAADGSCVSECGDGLILAGDAEDCDDGNNRSGDGCSADCKIEPGFVCETIDDTAGGDLVLNVVFRDFRGQGRQTPPSPTYTCGTPHTYDAGGHPDFERWQASVGATTSAWTDEQWTQICADPDYPPPDASVRPTDIAQPTPGLVQVALGADGKPQLAAGASTTQITSAATFGEWYRDTPDVNQPVRGQLVLAQTGTGTFVYDDISFFPLDDVGLVASGAEDPRCFLWDDPADEFAANCWDRCTNGNVYDTGRSLINNMPAGSEDLANMATTHNYSFTSEVRYWFEYAGGEVLEFRGDDDVFVFIKGRLVVDLGGVHEPALGSITLNGTTTDVSGMPLNLEEGNVYEAVVFQAERHTCQSNYKLTLSNFARQHSECISVCGDGVVAGDELCDDGEMNGMGYGFCTTTCTPGPRCGDGNLDVGNEECDNGTNLDGYYTCSAEGTDAQGQPCTPSCAPGCIFPGYCGDGVVQSEFGERCDLGVDPTTMASLNTGAYNGCSAACQLGPRCGDNELQMDQGEQCDKGDRRNGDGCSAICTVEGGGAR